MIEAARRVVNEAMRSIRQAFRAVGAVSQRTRKIQLVDGEGLKDEQLAGLELFQHFGFTSVLPKDTQLVVLPLGGRTTHAVVIATENTAYRLVLNEAGEVAIYNQWGDHVWLKKEGQMEVKAATRLLIDAPLTHFTGDITTDGTIVSDGDQVAGGISTMHHVHGGIKRDIAQTDPPS